MSSIHLTFLEIVSLLAVIHCFVLSLIILFSKYLRSSSNKYLGITLLIIALVGINNWFWDRNTSPMIIDILDVFLWQFLYPVTLTLFFQKTATKISDKGFNLNYLYIPFIFLSVCNITIAFSSVFGFYNLPQFISNHISLFYKGISLLSIVFPIYTIILSYKYIQNLKEYSSKKWLKHLWIYLSIILLFGVVLESYRFAYSEKLPLTYLWTLTSIFIYWLVYKGIFQFQLSNDRYEIRTITKKDKNKTPVHSKVRNSHLEKLIRLIEEEKIHHNPNLSRDIVAERLEISNGYLSQIIKEHTSDSFTDFINRYRIRDVKTMIKDTRFNNYNLLSIGLECGFNSKTSFYTNFKKETGLTPKEYKNK